MTLDNRGPWATLGLLLLGAALRLVGEGVVLRGLAESGWCPSRDDLAEVEAWLSRSRIGREASAHQ